MDGPSFQGPVFVGPSLDLSSVSTVVVVPVYPVPAAVYVFNCSPDVYFVERLATALFKCIEFDPLFFPLISLGRFYVRQRELVSLKLDFMLGEGGP